MARAIELDDPEIAKEALAQGAGPFSVLALEGFRVGFSSFRSRPILLWALETPAPRVAELLIFEAARSNTPLDQQTRENALQLAARRGDLRSCEAMSAAGWSPPPMLLAAHMLLNLLRSRGKAHRPQSLRPIAADAPKLTQAQALEPIVEWIIRSGEGAGLPMGQMPPAYLHSCSSQHAQTTLLMVAGSARVARALVEAGADLSPVDRTGRTALGCAIAQGDRGWIEELAKAGSSLDACVGDLHVGQAGERFRRQVAAEWAIDAARGEIESAVPAAPVSDASAPSPRRNRI